MTNTPTNESQPGPRSRRKTLGIILTRIVIPCWVLAGVIFKLAHATPTNLPPTILDLGHKNLGIDAHWLLATLLVLELFAVAVMFFFARWARPMAVFMLVAFCIILLAEIFQGNVTTCGCFGTLPIPPWVMLIIDGSLLAAVLLTWQRREPIESNAYLLAVVAACFVLIAGFTYIRVLGVKASNQRMVETTSPVEPQTTAQSSEVTDTNQSSSANNTSVAPNQPTTNLIQLPSFYSVDDPDAWVGKPFQSIDLYKYMTVKPKDLNKGKRYIVFYRKTCDHCEELIWDHFYGEPVAPTTLIAFPESADGFATAGVWDMPCDGCEMLELPVGPDWWIEPPMVIALNNGKVVCVSEAEESTEPQCLPWHVEAGLVDAP